MESDNKTNSSSVENIPSCDKSENDSTCEKTSDDTSSCEKLTSEEPSDFSLDSQSISENISNSISPLRGGAELDSEIPLDSEPGSVAEPNSEISNEAAATAHSLSDELSEKKIGVEYSTWDIVGSEKDMRLLNQPDVTLSATQSLQKDFDKAGSSNSNSTVRKNHSSPSDYLLKIIEWKNRKVPIITQNVNGPCPLIAILNVLSLRSKIVLPSKSNVISSEKLMEYLGDCIFSSYSPNNHNNDQNNYEQNIHDAIAVLPKLQTGLDVNIRFSGVRNFEYTPECIVFDLLNIPLYHGWLVEHESPEIVQAISSCSYNQLVEKIIENTTSTDPDLSYQALAADRFLRTTASQLTYQGLCELSSTINEDELAVLFRNNHFITVYKKQDELFQLVTDQGFSSETGVVWETLSNIEGDSQFVDGKFVVVPPMADPNLGVNDMSEQQVDHDYLVALSLQEEQKKQDDTYKSWNEYKQKTLGLSEQITDAELAKRLQEEENVAATAGNSSRRSSKENRRPMANRNKKSDCTIL